MNKISALLSSLIVMILLFASCSKSPEKVLDRKDGTWKATITSTETIDGVLDGTYVSFATFIFDDDDFTLIDEDNTVQEGTWSSTKDKVTLIIDNEAIILDVISSSKKSQEWEITEKDTYQGSVYEFKNNIKLTKE